MADARLHVLLRAPRPGLVKTRLGASLGDALALALHTAFTRDVADAVDACGLPAVFWVEPASDLDLARRWLGPRRYLPQPRGDLGARLCAAFAWSFAEGDRAALAIGSDLPELTPDLLRLAEEHLRRGRPVLGPSPDGGYWAIGFPADLYRPGVFADMPWSAPTLRECTLRALAGLDTAMLPCLDDIDTPGDLVRLAAACPRYAALLADARAGGREEDGGAA